MFREEPRERSSMAMPIVRARPNKPIKCVIACRQWVGVETHYSNGRTVMCPGMNTCTVCRIGSIPRWQGYLFVKLSECGNNALIQITPNVLDKLDQVRHPIRGLLGLRCIFSRAGQRINGPLVVYTYGRDETTTELQKRHLEQCLLRILEANAETKINGHSG